MDDDDAPNTASTSAVDFKSQLIDLLGIPVHLTGSGEVPLSVAYQKYKAFLVACSTLDELAAKSGWLIRRPTQTELIEVFVSKSFYHSHYRPLFSQLADYPQMVAWLDKPSDFVDVDVWGVKKASYSFTDLKAWLDNGGKLELNSEDEFEEYKVLKRGKGKGKGRERGLEKRKGKEKEKALEKRKEKEKEKEKKQEKEKGHKRKASGKRVQ